MGRSVVQKRMQKFALTLSQEDREILTLLANRQGTSMSGIIRMLAREKYRNILAKQAAQDKQNTRIKNADQEQG